VGRVARFGLPKTARHCVDGELEIAVGEV
jgi:hypothetical protein